MNLRSIKRNLIPLLLSFSLGTSASLAQQNAWIPTFKTTFRDRIFMRIDDNDLSRFLSYSAYVSGEVSLKCETRYGEFRFRVNGKGKVDSISVSGNLTNTITTAILTRIKSTDDHWTLPVSSSASNQCWFTFPFYMFIREDTSGCDQRGHASQQNHYANYKLLLSLPYSEQGILPTTTSVLIRPGHSEPLTIK